MKTTSSKNGSVLQGYFRAERSRGSANRAAVSQPKGPARLTPQPLQPELLPAKMRGGAAQAKPEGAAGGAWSGAPRPELLPGMRPSRMGGLRWLAQPRPGNGVSTTPIPAGQLRVIGEGRPLDAGIRQTMERFFQADFSGVRVHEGPAAQAMGALAFTLGEALHFAPGLYDPKSREGVELLGHELTHVVQQRDGRVANPYGQGVAIVQDPALEAEADRIGQQIADELWSGHGAGQPAMENGGLPRPATNPALMQTRATLQRVSNGFKESRQPVTQGTLKLRQKEPSRATLRPQGPTSLVDSPAPLLPKWTPSLRAGIIQPMKRDTMFPEKQARAPRLPFGAPARTSGSAAPSAQPQGRVIQRTYKGWLKGKYTLRDCLYNEKWYNYIQFTGYSYADENDYNCLACGNKGHTYKIFSTTLDQGIVTEWTKEMTNKLYEYYGSDRQRMNKEYKGKMIGVMYAGGRWYASHSGSHQSWISEAIPKGLTYLNYSDDEDVTTWGGSTVSRTDFSACQMPSSPGILQCAGAKLARYVARFKVSVPIYMTEMWVDPNQTHNAYTHAAITESCDTCREQIATIMCPYTPEAIAEEIRRESERERVFPPYTRGESRKAREFQLLEDVSAYTEPRPTFMLGFTLKKGSKIAVNDFNAGYYRVKLLSGWATYHCSGQQTKTVLPDTVFVPPMYVDAGIFKKTLMDLVW